MDVDRLIDEAWPALDRVPLGPWTLRHSLGVTKRANSVLVTGLPADLSRAVDVAEKFYAGHGLPGVFSLGTDAPAEVDSFLEARGYRLVDPTLVMVAAPAPVGSAAHEVRIEDHPWPAWLDTWAAVEGRDPEVAGQICAGVPAWYAAVEEDGVPLAVGRGVPQGDTLGIYCMATRPSARRRGLARSVLRALVRQAGSASAYLVVTEGNGAARSFYRAEGFEQHGAYHYRVA
ncbi:GNAT family N-acetyltransferase [Nonomuraea africana]|uniref:Ribosomal protein S18 acetylase RimI-like enzyme n=1 Tax=Nonomuraea africana TaxID=46171 RepID=A0ABR9K7Q0_9ACTN|nr:GNAT family N-acetyltransferase [Nonomuraea africana]MBE1558035.1 ribosomal protein S18 acetylase RimI-like enzyme [Nonomuraea africana]